MRWWSRFVRRVPPTGGARSLPTFGPGPERLLVDGRHVAAVAVARTTRERRRGLLGTEGVDGALWITRCPSVHMVGMRYPIDAAVLDRDGVVLRVRTLRPWTGATLPSWRSSATVEAAAGSMARWGIGAGSRLSVGRPAGVPPGSVDPPVDSPVG